MAIADHINLVQSSPLYGDSGNSRFVDMVGAYDPALRQAAQKAATAVGVRLPEGVYVWFSGPQFETPAEINFARVIGGTAAGMSTVPEVILARRLGLRCAAISSITNLAAGMGPPLSHAHTKAVAATVVDGLTALVRAFLDEEHG
jgi:purine nucleoside phosphorylase